MIEKGVLQTRAHIASSAVPFASVCRCGLIIPLISCFRWQISRTSCILIHSMDPLVWLLLNLSFYIYYNHFFFNEMTTSVSDHQLKVCLLVISRSPGFLLTVFRVFIRCHDQTWLLPMSEINRSGYSCSFCTSHQRCCCSHPHITEPVYELGSSQHLNQYALWTLHNLCI